jgi:hypothetical protein
VLDLNSKGPLTLLSHYQTPAQLRRAGHKRIAAYLRNRGVKGSDSVAHKALAAARSQSVTLPAQEVTSRIVAELAAEILALKERIESIDEEIGQRFFARPEARILISLPGTGLILGAEFLVTVGDICAFSSADRLAVYAGLVPAARDSGASGWVTTKGCEEGTRSSSGSSTSWRLPAYAALRSLRPSTITRGLRTRGTLRLSSLWRVGGSTSFGLCCVMEPRSRPALRLDIFIEILPGISVNRDTQDGTSRARDPSRPAEQMEQMERNRDILQDEYARLAPEALNALTSEELRQVSTDASHQDGG